MKRNQNSFTWLLIFAGLLLLIGMACQLGSTLEATPTPAPPLTTESPPTSEPAPVDTAVPQPTAATDPTAEPLPEPITITIEQLQAATVQIFAQFEVNGRLQTQWTGSGTIISPDGLILTNAHVAAPLSPGLAILYNDPEFLFGEEPDALVVALVERADAPPVETYLAEVAAADGTLDLAVIRIVSALDDTPVNAASLNLPYVELGDSDTIQLGDEVRVLGFPGAGGETITFTRGDVAGFESQDLVGNRAWIKTDTTVSPGNSGGLGANAAGQIVGIPSFVQEARGGAINRLRAINFARPLIDAARNQSAYATPYFKAGSGNETLRLVTWAEDFQDDGCAIGPLTSYGSGVLAAVAIFDYQGMTDGEQALIGWFNNDELILANVISWQDGSKGECFAAYVHNFGDPLPDGNYLVEIYAGPDLELAASAETTIGGTGGKAVADGVQLQGRITDADSGNPIPGAALFILNPGVDLDAWTDNPQDADVYSFAEADDNGNYFLPDLLERGFTYPGVAAASGYRPNEGSLTIDDADPDVMVIDLELNQ